MSAYRLTLQSNGATVPAMVVNALDVEDLKALVMLGRLALDNCKSSPDLDRMRVMRLRALAERVETL